MTLTEAANFCDNCGLPLTPSSGYERWTNFPPEANESRPQRSSPQTPAPAPSQSAATPSRAPQPASPGANLQQYRPEQLKAKLDAARASGEMVGERKLVTVLFTDIVGSTRRIGVRLFPVHIAA